MKKRGKIDTCQVFRLKRAVQKLSVCLWILVSVLPATLLAGLPSEFTSTVSDATALRILSSDPSLVSELSPLFKNRQFSSSVKQLKPFQQRAIIRKAKKNDNFRNALKSSHQKALPAAGIYSVSDSFTAKLIAAKNRGTLKIDKDGKVHGFRPGRKKKSKHQSLSNRTLTGTRRRPALSTNAGKRPSLLTDSKKISPGKSLSTSRKKPALSTSSRKTSVSSRKKPTLSASTRKRLVQEKPATSRKKPVISKTSRNQTTSQRKPASSSGRTVSGSSRTTSSGKKPVVSNARPSSTTVKQTVRQPTKTTTRPVVKQVPQTRKVPSASSTKSKTPSVTEPETSVTLPQSRSISSKTVKSNSLRSLPSSKTTIRK